MFIKILVTCTKGQLGILLKNVNSEVLRLLRVDIEEMDITNKETVRNVITNSDVDAIIHCAAYTAVDVAEESVELCRRINEDNTKIMQRLVKIRLLS